MSYSSLILLQQISYTHNNGNTVFQNLNLSFDNSKVGLIGKNGVGKSTLFRLIRGELTPSTGIITCHTNITYLPQQISFTDHNTVAELLNVQDKLLALERILKGSVDIADFNLLNDDWAIRENIQHQLHQFDIGYIQLDRKINSLSGGEITRLLLAKVFNKNAHVILLDEPTNNLDANTKKLLYQVISQWQRGLIIISHDRNLLQHMNTIVELTSLGAKTYGGNYEDYLQQKAIEQAAIQQKLHDAKRLLKQTKNSIQQSYERLEQRRKYGRSLRKSGSIDKLSANAAKGRSERSQKHLLIQEQGLLENANQQLLIARAKIETNETLAIKLSETHIPNGKMVLDIENICFSYSPNDHNIISDFNFKIMGPERIAIAGNNASGKTTLVKLILGILQPQQGQITVGVNEPRYLDQAATLLNLELTVLENFISFNPDFNTHEARSHLAKFLFREDAALKQVQILSGGEKLRAALACVLMAKQPPQLLILDEPTNHLDLESIAHIEAALNCYQGALLIISHDNYFIKNLGIRRFIQMA